MVAKLKIETDLESNCKQLAPEVSLVGLIPLLGGLNTAAKKQRNGERKRSLCLQPYFDAVKFCSSFSH